MQSLFPLHKQSRVTIESLCWASSAFAVRLVHSNNFPQVYTTRTRTALKHFIFIKTNRRRKWKINRRSVADAHEESKATKERERREKMFAVAIEFDVAFRLIYGRFQTISLQFATVFALFLRYLLGEMRITPLEERKKERAENYWWRRVEKKSFRLRFSRRRVVAAVGGFLPSPFTSALTVFRKRFSLLLFYDLFLLTTAFDTCFSSLDTK